MTEQSDPLMEPTSEYTMRHAANLLASLARNSMLRLSQDDIKTIDFAYQQLLRGANTLRVTAERAWEEGANAEASLWCETAIPCGSCDVCKSPAPVNPYEQESTK